MAARKDLTQVYYIGTGCCVGEIHPALSWRNDVGCSAEERGDNSIPVSAFVAVRTGVREGIPRRKRAGAVQRIQ